MCTMGWWVEDEEEKVRRRGRGRVDMLLQGEAGPENAGCSRDFWAGRCGLTGRFLAGYRQKLQPTTRLSHLLPALSPRNSARRA